jgi:hypothetical protein
VASDIVFIDEECLADCNDAELAQNNLNQLTEFLLEIDKNNNEAFMSIPYYDVKLGYREMPLYEILFMDPCPLNIPTEVVRQLGRLLGRCVTPNCDASRLVKVQNASGPLATTSRVYAAAFDRARTDQDYSAILRRVSDGSGSPAIITHVSSDVSCFIVSSKDDLRAFYREAIQVIQPAGEYFVDISRRAFPDLEIHPTVRLENLGLDLNLHIARVVHHLSFLNDHLRRIGDECGWDMFRLIGTASAMNVELSDESTNTKKVEKKMKERDCTFKIGNESVEVRCSYHTKIIFNKGRIHFFPSHEKFPGKTLVGIFHNHLTI